MTPETKTRAAEPAIDRMIDIVSASIIPDHHVETIFILMICADQKYWVDFFFKVQGEFLPASAIAYPDRITEAREICTQEWKSLDLSGLKHQYEGRAVARKIYYTPGEKHFNYIVDNDLYYYYAYKLAFPAILEQWKQEERMNAKYPLLGEAMYIYSIDWQYTEDDAYEIFDHWVEHNSGYRKALLIAEFSRASVDRDCSWLLLSLSQHYSTSNAISVWLGAKENIWDRITKEPAPDPWFSNYLSYELLISYVDKALMSRHSHVNWVTQTLNSPHMPPEFGREVVKEQFERALHDRTFNWSQVNLFCKHAMQADEETLRVFFKEEIGDELHTVYPSVYFMHDWYRLYNNYKKMSARYQSQHPMLTFKPTEVLKLINEQGFNGRVGDNGTLFVIDEYDAAVVRMNFRISLKNGLVEMMIGIERKDTGKNDSVNFSNIPPKVGGVPQLMPVFSNYNELREILIELFALYDDIKVQYLQTLDHPKPTE